LVGIAGLAAFIVPQRPMAKTPYSEAFKRELVDEAFLARCLLGAQSLSPKCIRDSAQE
jgi:hypothetical protein